MIRLDEYLAPNKSLTRLVDEYKKHGSLVIGFDFDSTVHDYHKTGESHEMVRSLLRDLKEINCKLVCWTAYPDLNYVANFLNENNIPFDSINEGGIPLGWESKKPFFSILLDDRAGLRQVYEELTELVSIVKPKAKSAKVEKIAEVIHELWMTWAQTLLESESNISEERKNRWEKECFIPYDKLSEDMKDLDRRFAKQIIDILQLAK